MMMNVQQRSGTAMRRLCGLLATVVLTGACQSKATTPAVSADAWAVVDGREIRKEDVEKAYRAAVEPTTPGPSKEEVLAVQLNIIDELITQDILLARAKAQNLDATDAEVDAAFAERKGTATDQQFQQQLLARAITVDDVKRNLRRELTVQKLIDKDIAAKADASDQEITDYYTQNKAQFNLSEMAYRLAQIVVTPGRDPQLRNRMNDDASTPEEGRRKVEMLTERLKAGSDFASLAMDYSEDPQSVGQGGDLGFVTVSGLAKVSPVLRDTVARMEPGNINTLNVGGGYMILMMLAKEPAGQRELTTPSVKDGIRDLIKSRKQELLRVAYIQAARSDAKIVNVLAKQVVESLGKVPSLVPAAPK